MRYIWMNEGGMVPGIGAFNTGDEVPADIALLLKDAGYTLQEVPNGKVLLPPEPWPEPAPQIIETNEGGIA